MLHVVLEQRGHGLAKVPAPDLHWLEQLAHPSEDRLEQLPGVPHQVQLLAGEHQLAQDGLVQLPVCQGPGQRRVVAPHIGVVAEHGQVLGLLAQVGEHGRARLARRLEQGVKVAHGAGVDVQDRPLGHALEQAEQAGALDLLAHVHEPLGLPRHVVVALLLHHILAQLLEPIRRRLVSLGPADGLQVYLRVEELGAELVPGVNVVLLGVHEASWLFVSTWTAPGQIPESLVTSAEVRARS